MSMLKPACALLFTLAFGAAHAAAPAAATGEEVVKKSCAMCHQTPGIGAPLIGNKAEWAERVTQGTPLLYEHAIKGYQGKKGVMPPKGANPALSDAEVKAAVDFMLSKVK